MEIGPTNYPGVLNFGLILIGELERDNWGVMGDFICLDFGIDDKDSSTVEPSILIPTSISTMSSSR